MVWLSQVTDLISKCKIAFVCIYVFHLWYMCKDMFDRQWLSISVRRACICGESHQCRRCCQSYVSSQPLSHFTPIRTGTQTERRLRVSDALRPKPCGRRLRGPRWGRRRGHWSRQRHFSSPTHVRAFLIFWVFLPFQLLQCIISRFLCVAVGRRYPTALTNTI